jgi:hypothetical protein
MQPSGKVHILDRTNPAEPLGLSLTELETLITRRMTDLDDAQDDQDMLGGYADLLRTATLIAYHRSAELIEANNRRLEAQLRALGVLLAD